MEAPSECTIALVGGQNCGKSSVLESIVGIHFLPGIATRRPLELQLHKIDKGKDYAQFSHIRKRFTDFAVVAKEITDKTNPCGNGISGVPLELSIYSPNVENLTLIDLPGLTRVTRDGQSDSIVADIENVVRSFIEKPNCLILAVSPANEDLATSDALKIARDVDPKGERTFGVLTKIDLVDKGTEVVDVFEGKSYGLQFPWIGVVNRSRAEGVDMIAARCREREYFANTPEYSHLAHRMGSEHLGKMLLEYLGTVIIPVSKKKKPENWTADEFKALVRGVERFIKLGEEVNKDTCQKILADLELRNQFQSRNDQALFDRWRKEGHPDIDSTSNLAETHSVLVASQVSEIIEVDAASEGEAVRLEAAAERMKGELAQLMEEHDKEREAWRSESQALKAKLEFAESTYLHSQIEAEKMRTQLESELYMKNRLLNTRDTELMAAKKEITRLESELSSYKVHADSLLQTKNAEELLKAQEEAVKEAERDATLSYALTESEKSFKKLQDALDNHDKELAKRDAALESAEQRIRSIEQKLEFVTGAFHAEKQTWLRHLEDVEVSWRLRCDALKIQNQRRVREIDKGKEKADNGNGCLAKIQRVSLRLQTMVKDLEDYSQRSRLN